jgi:hypothetical protein
MCVRFFCTTGIDMRGEAMLIEFRVSNFRSFNEEQVLSLVAARKDHSHPGSLVDCNGSSLVKTAVIYGANASGKSNLIKAFETMRTIVCNSKVGWTQGDPIPGVSPFRLSQMTTDEPTKFEVVLLLDDTYFVYGFSATQDRVHDEYLLVRPPRAKEQTWFRRTLDTEKKTPTWDLAGLFARETKGQRIHEKTRNNSLLLSCAADDNVKCSHNLFSWFKNELRVLDLSDKPSSLLGETLGKAQENAAFLGRAKELLRDADFGIHDIAFEYHEVDVELQKWWGKPVLPSEIKTLHRVEGSDDFTAFDMLADESLGTKRFFALTGPFLDALEKGAVVVVDELECSMHPLLTRKLIELFQDPEQNKKGAQLIFATHDVSLMDPCLFRRDQIWIVEKRQNGASVLFSLYDFETEERPRNTEAFQRNYLAGRYGGVPSFGPFFENLEGR